MPEDDKDWNSEDWNTLYNSTEDEHGSVTWGSDSESSNEEEEDD